MSSNIEVKLKELEAQFNKLSSDYKAVLAQLEIFKKKINKMSADNDSIHLRLDNVESIIEDDRY